MQSVGLEGDVDQDEVQQIRLEAAIGTMGGSYSLGFDTTSCGVCAVRATGVTSLIQVTAPAQGVVGTSVQEILEDIAPDNIDSVTVTRDAFVDGFNDVVLYNVTFSGIEVGGNLEELTVQLNGVSGTSPSLVISTIQDGNEVDGNVTLTFDDTQSRPPGEGPPQNVSIAYDATPAEVKAAIESMATIPSVDVDFVYTGGPGLRWLVTFTNNLGDVAEMGCNDTELEVGTGPIGDTFCNLTTVTVGAFLEGSFFVKYANVTSRELAWNTTREEMALAIDEMDTIFSGINVTRFEYFEDPLRPELWTGTFTWTVTFVGMKFDLWSNLHTNENITFLTGAENARAVTGNAENPVTETETNPLNVETNEIQLIDCQCSDACSGGFNLSVYGEVADRVFHNSTMYDLKDALEALTSINTVSVRQHGDNTTLGHLCTETGTTTAITFTHNPGNIPPIQVSNAPGSYDLESTAGSGAASMVILHGDYQFGAHGGMSRDGSRILRPCSDRGVCLENGLCSCYDGFGNSNGAGIHLDVGHGDRVDCGNMVGVLREPLIPASGEFVTNCPLGCLGNGICQTSTFVCVCDPPFEGPACEKMDCPEADNWYDEALGPPEPAPEYGAHRQADCGGRGLCDSTTGLCRCAAGFEGASCDRTRCDGFSLAQGQGGVETRPEGCNSRGECLVYGLMANRSRSPVDGESFASLDLVYTGWDRDKMQGCACNRSRYAGKYSESFRDFFGPDCSQARCATGADPRDKVGVFERQRITCNATGGNVVLDFRGDLSIRIPWDASVIASPRRGHDTLVEYLQESIPAIGLVSIHPAPATRNFTNKNVTDFEDTLDVVNGTLTSSRSQVLFPGTNCRDRGLEAKDFALSCDEDVFNSAICWPFPRLCGTTDDGEPFQTDVTFLSQHGDVPLLQVSRSTLASGDILIEEIQKGTKEMLECNGRGACDFQTGQCVCAPGFGSSDGRFGEGGLGDCGFLHAHKQTEFEFVDLPLPNTNG